MIAFRHATMLAVVLVLTPLASAQTATQSTADTKAQLKAEHHALKAQAKADRKERKALGTHAQKKADKAQDKADRERAKAGPTG